MGYVKNNVFDISFKYQDKKMVIVHKEDTPAVLLIQPDMTNGPWIAGGAVLNWFNGEAVQENDIDVFFHDLHQFDETFGRLMRNHGNIIYTSDNAVTLSITLNNKPTQIQLIRKNWFNNAKEVIDRFDITVCQLVTDGFELVLGEDTAEHIKQRSLVLTKEPNRSIVKRILKYITYGYLPDPKVMQEIIDNHENYDWKFNTMDDHYENAF